MKIKLFVVTLDLTRLRATRQGLGLFVDLFMIGLVFINLALIFFDYSFSHHSFQVLLGFISPAFVQWYGTKIHPHASFLDLIFVSIFLTELLIRWIIAARRKTYESWFLYPFIHWYDVLGCIPMSGSLKLLRLLRVIGMVARLQKLGIIDIRETFIYRKSRKYIAMLVEEISDSVVLNVLSGLQAEAQKGNPIVEKIANQVISPKKEQISIWMSERLSESIGATYFKNRLDFYQYLKEVVTKSVKENQEIKRIALIPGVGKILTDVLDGAISNITFNVIDNMMEDLAKGKNLATIQDITDQIINQLSSHEHDHEQLNIMVKEIVVDSIDVIKQQIEVKQWKINELTERKSKLISKIAQGRGNAIALQAEIDIINEDLKKMHN